ncbi:MAG TPA: 50S ribosomal protein L9 [Kiloniellales bacterium]|nr:50S ribosomal protein L9 [Kiloniellales bacterium]
MQVILLERVENLGQMGDVVSVRPGFARNYLLPQRKARRATKENLALFEQQRAQLEADNLERRKEAEKVGQKLDGVMVTLIRQAGDSGQLYGSVNARDLADAVTEAGFTIDRSQVVLDRVIKALGLHDVRIRLHPEVTVTVKANVARSEADAEVQAKTGHIMTREEQLAAEEAAEAKLEATLEELESQEPSEDSGEESGEPETAEPSPAKPA